MYTTVPMEVAFFLASLAAGGIAAFVFDLLRISRRLKKPSVALVNLEDVLFLVFAAAILFAVAYLKNSGEIRWQGLIGFGLGAICYALVMKNRFLNLGTAIIKGLFGLVGKILRIIAFPVRVMVRVFEKPVRIIAWHTGREKRRMKHFVRRLGYKIALQLKKTEFLLRKK